MKWILDIYTYMGGFECTTVKWCIAPQYCDCINIV